MDKIGILINNIGTPDSPERKSVARYLRQFLSDPYVLQMPGFIRYPLVYGWIAPFRSKSSAEKYKKIWTANGSPLLEHSLELAKKLELSLGENYVVRVGMRYGSPSLPTALQELKSKGVTKIVFAPLYPQWSESTTESAVVELKKYLSDFSTLESFYREDYFLDSSAELIRAHLPKEFDHFLFSFHGLPESQVRKNPACSISETCCANPEMQCYRAQCMASAREIAKRAGLSSWSVSFQSRVGPAKWIGPSTISEMERLAQSGKKRIAVHCPSFVADCLETLEEIQLENKHIFLSAGGKEFSFIPCLNSEQQWVNRFSLGIKNYCLKNSLIRA